jgi:hypothetical protein
VACPGDHPWGEPGGLFRDFRFLAPGTRLNAFSEVSGIEGPRRLVRLADFGELNTQKLILCELPEKCALGPGRRKCSARRQSRRYRFLRDSPTKWSASHRIDMMEMLKALVAHAPRRAASTLVSMPGQWFHHPAACIETSLDAARRSAYAT